MTATDQHVSRSNKQLQQAIKDGEVPKPPLCAWNAWQNWRKTLGERPTVQRDGATTSQVLESQLWRSTMIDLYGADWTYKLAEGEHLPVIASAAETADVAAAAADVSVPSGTPVAPQRAPPEEATSVPHTRTAEEPEPAVLGGTPARAAAGQTEEPVTPRRQIDPMNPGSGDSKEVPSPGSGTSGCCFLCCSRLFYFSI